ncbi:sialoadhesin-like [Parambassis ranga]|uniref:Sialoadhesin-like n=1 Tax=Parambassis ranga TaxID=210632 RepID=A0A6P7IDX7_9TELE|nr:sialoadhesin-like [Parambassis ranga]
MKGSTCNIHFKWSGNGVYWCESGSAFSNAVNITGQSQYKEVVMVSPAHPVTEGTSVSLGCRLRTEKVVSNVFFYKNDKLIQSDTRGELNISAVSKADEGFYRCQCSGHESPQSWMAVKSVTRPESSLFLTLLIVGLVCGILLLILLLLLLCRYKHSKDSCFVRSQSTTAEHTINQDEAQCSPHTSSPQGDVSVYETIKEPENTEHGESSDVTYSLIELKCATKKGKKQKPVESRVYSDVKIRSSAGQPAPAAAGDGAVYAEVKRRTDQ